LNDGTQASPPATPAQAQAADETGGPVLRVSLGEAARAVAAVVVGDARPSDW